MQVIEGEGRCWMRVDVLDAADPDPGETFPGVVDPAAVDMLHRADASGVDGWLLRLRGGGEVFCRFPDEVGSLEQVVDALSVRASSGVELSTGDSDVQLERSSRSWLSSAGGVPLDVGSLGAALAEFLNSDRETFSPAEGVVLKRVDDAESV